MLTPLPAAGAQGNGPDGRLVRAFLTAELGGEEEAPARVVIEYEVLPGPDARAVPFRAVALRGAGVSGLEAREAGGRALDVVMDPGGPPSLSGRVLLPPASRDGAPLRLTLTYEVLGALERRGDLHRYTLPVAAVLWPPREAGPGVFSAEAVLPVGLSVREGFPAVFRRSRLDDGRAAWRADLPVVPSQVSVRAVAGSRPLVTLPLVLDGALILLAAGVGWVGWRRWVRSGEAGAR